MSKKELFISEIEKLIESGVKFSEDALVYFESLKITEDKEKKTFTENGKLILKYMQDNKDTHNNLFKSKDIAEGLEISSRTVSGGMKKLVTDGYVEKMGDGNPICYSITNKGIEVNFEEA